MRREMRSAAFVSRAMRMLHCYQFPGNVREFTLVMRRAVELAGYRLITLKDLMLEGRLSRIMTNSVKDRGSGESDGPPS